MELQIEASVAMKRFAESHLESLEQYHGLSFCAPATSLSQVKCAVSGPNNPGRIP
jgi:hypothetical protein